MKGPAAIAAILAATSACSPGDLTDDRVSRSEALPIIGGFATNTDPAVVFTSTSTGNCTGTLVSPRVVLTAAHCVIDSIESGLTNSGSVGFGDEAGNFDQTVGIADMYAHRYYDPAVVRRYDIGLIRLGSPVDNVTPVPFNDQTLDESFLGAQVRVLGFGVTDGESQTGAGTKREVNLTIDELTTEHIGLGNEVHNICQGDSGGPTLLEIDGQERVAAVSSFGSNACMNRSYVTRVDIYADVIGEVISAWDGPCQQDGKCVTDGCGDFPDPDCDVCGFDGVCASGCPNLDLDCPVAGFAGDDCEDNDGCESRLCVEALDDPDVHYCSATCDPADPEPCPAPLGQCEEADDGESYCYYPGTTPGVQGADCSSADDCRSGICDSKHDICIEPCGDGLPACAEPYHCKKVNSQVKACTLGSEGGCDAAGSGRGAAGALILVGFLLLMRRRFSYRGPST